MLHFTVIIASVHCWLAGPENHDGAFGKDVLLEEVPENVFLLTCFFVNGFC